MMRVFKKKKSWVSLGKMLCVLLYLSTLMPGPHWRVCFTSRSDTILTVLGKSNKNVKLSHSEALPARVGNLHLVSWAGPVPRLLGLQGRRRGHDWAWAEGWRWGDLLLIGGLCKSLQGGWVMERTWVRSWTSCVALDKLLTLSEFPLGGGKWKYSHTTTILGTQYKPENCCSLLLSSIVEFILQINLFCDRSVLSWVQ